MVDLETNIVLNNRPVGKNPMAPDSTINKMKRYLLLFLLGIFIVAPSAEARIYLDINAPTFVQIPIVLGQMEIRRQTLLLLFGKGL